jgi:hypothetical protein
MKAAATALELRVLAGPQAGARAPLVRGAACRIGGGPMPALLEQGAQGPDIVLHAGGGFVIQVRWPADHEPAVVSVLEGQALLGAQAVVPGVAQAWRMGQTLSFDDVVLAYGPAAVDVWLDAATEPAQTASSASLQVAARAGAERWLLGAGAGLVLACGGLFALVEVLSPAANASAAAAASPLAKPATSRHDTDELARQVADVFRLHGLAVEAQARADGGVLVQARERDSWRVEQAEQAARRDVAGLPSLTVRNQPPALATTTRAPLEPDAGKRITSVVDNADAPFFVTADGSRYFVGALLPSGHRVLLIADKSVTVERDGQLTKLTL